MNSVSCDTPFAPQMVTRNSDILTTVKIQDNSAVTCRKIAELAAEQDKFPNYPADNAGVSLVFHTENEEYLLGGVRPNQALQGEFTKDGTPFPQQIIVMIGGYLPNADLPFREAAINAVKNKMFLNTPLTGEGLQAQATLDQLCESISADSGWEDTICVHTDKWLEDGAEKTMCVLTAIKHINCKNSELLKIEEALKTIMAIKTAEGANLRTLTAFQFTKIKPILGNSLNNYLKSELEKATNAYEKYGNQIAVTFNELAVATLALNGAFAKTSIESFLDDLYL